MIIRMICCSRAVNPITRAIYFTCQVDRNLILLNYRQDTGVQKCSDGVPRACRARADCPHVRLERRPGQCTHCPGRRCSAALSSCTVLALSWAPHASQMPRLARGRGPPRHHRPAPRHAPAGQWPGFGRRAVCKPRRLPPHPPGPDSGPDSALLGRGLEALGGQTHTASRGGRAPDGPGRAHTIMISPSGFGSPWRRTLSTR
jgi:hypothetical protein